MSDHPPRLVLLAPIEPSPTGNGLAMRQHAFARAAAHDHDVDVVVVPVAGRAAISVGGPPGVRVRRIGLPDRTTAARGLAPLLARAEWRQRLTAAGEQPATPALALPGLVEEIVELVGPGPAAVHVGRSSLAPLGVALAEALGAPRRTLDLDDDDEAFARMRGEGAAADAHHRLLGAFGGAFDAVALAAPADAAAIAARHGLPAVGVPNGVEVPAVRPTSVRSPVGPQLLFVGNLTYEPNAAAAAALAEAVVPTLLPRLPDAHLQLVGPATAALRDRLRGRAAVELTGALPDLAPAYQRADLVVAPLAVGSGTRIKLLEAFALGVPVVCSSAAAAGLDAEDGRHLLLADGTAATVDAIERLWRDPGLGDQLAAAAFAFVGERYAAPVVEARMRSFLAGPP